MSAEAKAQALLQNKKAEAGAPSKEAVNLGLIRPSGRGQKMMDRGETAHPFFRLYEQNRKGVSAMKRKGWILPLAVLMALTLAMPAFADVMWEPYGNNFYEAHRDECQYENRTYLANGPEGYLTLRESLQSSAEVDKHCQWGERLCRLPLDRRERRPVGGGRIRRHVRQRRTDLA